MVKGHIYFNCLTTNDNLRGFSRGDCFVQALEPLVGMSNNLDQPCRLRITYQATSSKLTVTADVELSSQDLLKVVAQAMLLRDTAIDGPV